jgi:steroid 5-alpha reductase family enzyme
VSQAVLAMLVNGSVMHILINSTKEDKIKDDPIVITGTVVWALGFIFEFFADLQMIDYQDLPASKRPAILKTGLWRYSRHPNYFGEILCWLGIYIIACSGNSAKTGGALTIYSPLVIILLLNYVTGVPLMEQGKMKSKDYRIYMKETNSIVPWLPSPIEDKDRTSLMDQIEKEIKTEAKK